MTFAIKANVTTRHIKESVKGDAKNCAIALAILDSDDDIIWARVTKQHIRVARASTDCIRTYENTAEGHQFVEDFDNGKPTRPFPLRVEASAYRGERPRRTEQAQRDETVQRRRRKAKIEGKKLSDIHKDDAEVWDAEGFVAVDPKPKVIREPRKPTRKYNQRHTSAERMKVIEL